MQSSIAKSVRTKSRHVGHERMCRFFRMLPTTYTLMFNGNTYSHVWKRGVVLLIKKGLIEYLDGERTFKTTEKGMNFFRIYNRVQELSPPTTKLKSNSMYILENDITKK